MSKQKIFEIYWDDEMGEAIIKDRGIKNLTCIEKLDLINDITYELNELSKGGFTKLLKKADKLK